MIIPCEVASKSVVPAIKALMAKELVENRGFKQEKAATILGISQSAISKYTRGIRGYAIKVDNVDGLQPLIGQMADLLSMRRHRRDEFLKLFCQACMKVRGTNSMCPFCRAQDLHFEIEDCRFCVDNDKRRLG